MNELALPDDVAFWSLQMTEHALFLSLLLEDRELKSTATELHWTWLQATPVPHAVTSPLASLIAFKEHVLSRLNRGEWLGWCLPSFCAHILMEARYFQARLSHGTSSSHDVQTFLQIVKDHADVGPKLVDPAGPASLTTSAAQLSQKLGALQKVCSAKIHAGCLHEADDAFMAASAWVRAVPPASSIIPSTLAQHIVRENERGRLVIRRLGGF